MANYAVIKIGPRQHIVEADKQYTVDKFQANVGDKVEFDVLALGTDKEIEVGTPLLDKVKVQVEILDQGKGEKVVTKQYKAKSRYHRTRGFRKRETTFKVISIK